MLTTAIAGARGGLNYANSRSKGLNQKKSTAVGVTAAVPTAGALVAGDKVRDHLLSKGTMAKKIAKGEKLSLADKAVAGHLGKTYAIEAAGLAAGGLAAHKLQDHFLHKGKKRRSTHQGINTSHDQHWNNTTQNF